MISYKNIETELNYNHFTQESYSVDFHLHSGCEIYYLISGDIKYFVEKQIYDVTNMDIFITNHHEIHKPYFESSCLYERITLNINPSFLEQFSTKKFNLSNCFYNREKGTKNKISLTKIQLSNVLNIFNEIEMLKISRPDYFEILYVNAIVRLLVLLNDYASNEDLVSLNHLPDYLIKILDYIDNNLEKDLSLSFFEQYFYVNKYYLCRTFKEFTNSSLHKYIVKKRISHAKDLLSQGMCVSEVAERTGFIDYSNFIKVFKKNVGMPPGKYKKK